MSEEGEGSEDDESEGFGEDVYLREMACEEREERVCEDRKCEERKREGGNGSEKSEGGMLRR